MVHTGFFKELNSHIESLVNPSSLAWVSFNFCECFILFTYMAVACLLCIDLVTKYFSDSGDFLMSNVFSDMHHLKIPHSELMIFSPHATYTKFHAVLL